MNSSASKKAPQMESCTKCLVNTGYGLLRGFTGLPGVRASDAHFASPKKGGDSDTYACKSIIQFTIECFYFVTKYNRTMGQWL